VAIGDAVQKDDLARRLPCPERQDGLIFGRGVPGACPVEIGELDHDEVAGPVALLHIHRAAMDQEAAAMGAERVIDAAQIFDDLGTHRDLAQMGGGIGGHGASPRRTTAG